MSKHMLLSACVRATLFKAQIRDRLAKGLVAMAAASPVLASADSDIAGMLSSAATGSSSATKSVLTIAQLAGVIFVCGGVVAAKTKKDNPQVKVSHIVGAIVFGVCLIAVPELIKRSQTQIGLTPINVG